jgi:septum formation protein
MTQPLFLASTSPRRRELLAQLGLTFSVLKIDIDESRRNDEAATAYVRRLAEEKARAGLAQITNGIVIAADTSVVYEQWVLGKPASLSEAKAIWQKLSGKTHQVLTGVAVASQAGLYTEVVSTAVHFRTISEQEMEAYWASSEPCDKAGGYAIQGRGAVFVEGIEGSYSNVVGLPLAETTQLLARFGVSIWDAAP